MSDETALRSATSKRRRADDATLAQGGQSEIAAAAAAVAASDPEGEARRLAGAIVQENATLRSENSVLRSALARAEGMIAERDRADRERAEELARRAKVPAYQRSRAIAAVVARSSDLPTGSLMLGAPPLVRSIVDGTSECSVTPYLVAVPDFVFAATNSLLLLERRLATDASIVTQIKNALDTGAYYALDLLIARICSSMRTHTIFPNSAQPRRLRTLLCWCESVRTLTFNIQGHIVFNIFMAPAHAQSFIYFAGSMAHALVHNHAEPHDADARAIERMILARLADDVELVACYDMFQQEWFRMEDGGAGTETGAGGGAGSAGGDPATLSITAPTTTTMTMTATTTPTTVTSEAEAAATESSNGVLHNEATSASSSSMHDGDASIAIRLVHQQKPQMNGCSSTAVNAAHSCGVKL